MSAPVEMPQQGPRRRPNRRLLLVIAIVGLALAGGGGYYYSTYLPSLRPLVPRPGNFVHQTFFTPTFLDPAVCYENACAGIIGLVYETLVYYERDRVDKLVPKLATEWSVSADGMVYTFKLRAGVKFHDGSTLTAEDVKYSIDRTILINAVDGPAWILAQSIEGGPGYLDANTQGVTNETEVQTYLAAEGVKIIDALTIQFVLDHPYSAFISTLAFNSAAIVSKACVEANGGLVPGFQNEWMNQNARCGSGPYRFIEWIPNDRVVLERNEDYWGPKPAISRFLYQTVPEITARLSALYSGAADSIYVGSPNAFDVIQKDSWITQGQIAPVEKGLSVTVSEKMDIFIIFLNTRIKPLDNRDFRWGLQHVFDYDTYIKTILNGFGFRLRGVIPKGMLGYDSNLQVPEYNLEKAREFFLKAKAAGAFKEGETLTVYFTASIQGHQGGALLLREGVAKANVGFKLEAQELDFPTLAERTRRGDLPIFFFGWLPDYADPDDYIFPFAHSLGYYAGAVGYSDESIDELVVQGRREIDPEKRTAIYRQIEKKISDEGIYLYLNQARDLNVQRDWVQGFFYNPMFGETDTGPMPFMWKLERTDQVEISISGFWATFGFPDFLGSMILGMKDETQRKYLTRTARN